MNWTRLVLTVSDYLFAWALLGAVILATLAMNALWQAETWALFLVVAAVLTGFHAHWIARLYQDDDIHKEYPRNKNTMNDSEPMSIKEFREFGYLQEVNRQFFHPLGLALAVMVDSDSDERLGYVIDGREDPEGMVYAEEAIDPQKTRRVRLEQLRRGLVRVDALGFDVQPVGAAGNGDGR